MAANEPPPAFAEDQYHPLKTSFSILIINLAIRDTPDPFSPENGRISHTAPASILLKIFASYNSRKTDGEPRLRTKRFQQFQAPAAGRHDRIHILIQKKTHLPVLAFRHTDKPDAAKSFLPLFRVLLPDSCPKTALRS
ncbi:hypothetical protein VQ056_08660 [Paenibacillus sp. JTLBN-2024]